MDEETMEISIAGYKEQINQLDSLLLCCDEKNKHELIQLKADLTELTKVTEESLLSLKKSRLLQELTDDTSLLSQEKDDSLLSSASNALEGDENETDGSKFMGIKCRVRHSHEWGQTRYQNAMVFRTEENKDGEQKVRVLFMNPTHMSMVPCSFFLNGKCRFTEEKCRFSHGYLADLSDLEEYIEPDFSLLYEGEKCLAKYEDSIWYYATIQKVHDEKIDIHYDTYDMDATVDIHEVLPVAISSNDDGESSSGSEFETESSRSFQEDDYVAEISRDPIRSTGPLGEWETHTKGIGSKLMAKMGYVFGKGLGKDGEGRVEPIDIVILPAGKSLDEIAELRKNGRLHKPLKKKKSKKNFAKLDRSVRDGGGSVNNINKGTDVFEFINSKLTHYDCSGLEEEDIHKEKVKHNIEESYQQLKRIRESKRKGESSHRKQHSGPNWNIQLFKNNEKAMSLKRRLAKQKESLKRNLGRDQEMVSRLQSDIKALETELKELETSGRTIENKLQSKSEHKKLTVF